MSKAVSGTSNNQENNPITTASATSSAKSTPMALKQFLQHLLPQSEDIVLSVFAVGVRRYITHFTKQGYEEIDE
jgi:hypothetical protein